MSPSAIGVESKAAIKRAATWGSPVACGAGDGILILPHSLKLERPNLTDDSLGLYFAHGADTGEVKVEGEIPCYLRYEGLEVLLALAMGQTADEASVVPMSNPYMYYHLFRLAERTEGLMATFAFNNGANVDEYPSVKITGFTLKGEVGKPLQITFSTIAQGCNRNTGSGTNNLTTMQSVTFAETSGRVLMQHGHFWMNDSDGGTFGAEDRIYPSSFELAFKRTMRGVYGSNGGYLLVDEPTNDGRAEITLKMEFPRYTEAARFTDWQSGVNKKLSMLFTQKAVTLGGSYDFGILPSFRVSFPNLKPSSVELSVDQGIMKHPVEYTCLAAPTMPTGMASKLPFEINVENHRETYIL